jgi:NAD(P)-dependent dehydrogenase (short-subunit alcohol dehydrogenase family)
MDSRTATYDGKPIRFDGRVAIVTGAGRGLGRSHALLLARLGASVVVNDLGGELAGGGSSSTPAHAVVAEIEAAGGEAMADTSDVGSYSEAQHLVESTIERFGQLDIVIANAGISDPFAPFNEMTPERFDRLVRVQLYGTFNVVQCAWPHLQAADHGRVVMTTSNGGLYGAPHDAHYAAAKMGVVGMMRSLANEGRADGIMVNVVSPGAFTRMLDSSFPPGEVKERLRSLSPPSGVSPVYAWLAHPSCEVTGEIFGAVGGRITRVFIGQTTGYIGAATVEDVRDHLDEAMDEHGYWTPIDVKSDGEVWINTLTSAAEATLGSRAAS